MLLVINGRGEIGVTGRLAMMRPGLKEVTLSYTDEIDEERVLRHDVGGGTLKEERKLHIHVQSSWSSASINSSMECHSWNEYPVLRRRIGA